MDEGVETVSDRLPNHFAARHQLGIQPVQYVFQVLTFTRLFGVEQFEELLNESMCNVEFECLDICCLVDY